MDSAQSSPRSSELGISEAPTPEPDLADLPELVPDIPTNIELPTQNNRGRRRAAQTRAMPVVINVTGNSSIKIPADRATLSIFISKESKSREESVQRVTESASRVQSLLRWFSTTDASNTTPACIEYNTNSINTSSSKPYYDHDTMEKEPAEEHTTNVGFSATFGNFEALAKVNAELVTIPEVQIGSVIWDISDELRAKHETHVRTEAIHDAKTQAQDYARALGCGGFLRPVEVAGEGTSITIGGQQTPVLGRMGFSAPARRLIDGNEEPERDPMNLDPPKMEISCSIQVKWEVDA